MISPSFLSSDMGDARLFAHFHGDNITDDDHAVKEEEFKFDLHMDNAKSKLGNESGTSYRSEKNDKTKSLKQVHNKVRRHKFAFQTRSQVDVLDDGYRWRKYGQKTVKNSKFPRLVSTDYLYLCSFIV